MRKALLLVCLSLVPFCAQCQGLFLFLNLNARTQIGSLSGPLAGPGNWAQMVAGSQSNVLTAVGVPVEHVGAGIVSGGEVAVPGIPGEEYAFLQLVAWDGTIWGTSLSGVPAEQLGRTDIDRHQLSFFFQPMAAPHFTQPAVVPPIPEPSVWALGLLGSLLFFWRLRSGRIHRSP